MHSTPVNNLYSVLTIKEIVEVLSDFKTFTFDTTHPIEYRAGQYLTLVHRAQQEVRRSYSIVSAPALNEPLSIGVKRIANGIFSRHLVDEARIGDNLLTTGAGGFFQLPAEIETVKKIYFFAAGSGITPVFSLIKSALSLHPNVKLCLVYSNHSQGTTIFYHQLVELEKKFQDRFQIHFLYSDYPDLRRARLNRDLLLRILDQTGANRADYYYTCGPAAYMRMITFVLQANVVPASHIKKEDFLPVRPTRKILLPPDKGSYFVTLYFKENEYHFRVNYPDSILMAAKKEKLALPFSCEIGKCGNCVARCLKGKVWMSDNEILMDEDISRGLTLTCVGHPVGGNVVLRVD